MNDTRKPGKEERSAPKRERKDVPEKKWKLSDFMTNSGLFRRGVGRRWIVNSVGVVLSVVVAVVIFSAMSLSNYYYNSMLQGMITRASSASEFFSSYAATESEYLEMANFYVSTFDDRDRLELQFVDTKKQKVILSSLATYGLASGTEALSEDVLQAVETKEVSSWAGEAPGTGERVLAVSSPIISGGEVRGVMRLITSLSAVDRQIIYIVCLLLLAGALVVFLVYGVSIYFIKSIVDPVTGITEVAHRIADGSYGIQLEKQYDDEIGDLTDAINEMSRKISENERLKSEFISSVSHELRTPLTAINGWGETLLSGELADPEDNRKGLSIIVSEGKRLAQMVEELLEFSRIEDGRFTLNLEPVDIKAEFEDAVYTYRQFFQKQGIQLHHNDCDEEFDLIPGDPQRLRQVFCNLLDNAAKHGGSGECIRTAIARLEDMVCITIRDYGPGIPEEELPFVKKKFYKGSSKARGNGIGLAVCDEIITRHGGRLDISNSPGGGCLVRIILPLSGAAQEKTPVSTGTMPLEEIRAEMVGKTGEQQKEK